MDLSLGFLFWSIDLYICLCANTILSWWLWLCSIVWSQAGWFLQFHSSFPSPKTETLSAIKQSLLITPSSSSWVCVCVCVCMLNCLWLFTTPGTSGFSHGIFFRQRYWSGLSFPLPRDLPDPGIEPVSLCLLHCRWILYLWVTYNLLFMSMNLPILNISCTCTQT